MSEPQILDPVAQPVSMLLPAENSVEAAPRPSWLPDDWKIKLSVRLSGSTAGVIDRYYIGPSGRPRLRSKNEVLNFLETGSKKRKSTSEADAVSSESSAGLPEMSRKNRKKSDVPESPITSPKKSRKKSKKAENASNKSAHVEREKEWMSRHVSVWEESMDCERL